MGNNMKNDSNVSASRYASLALAIVSLGVGFLCFFLFAGKCTSKFTEILTYVAGAILCLLAVMCAVYFAMDSKQKANFFLLDRNSGRNISISELDFDMVNSKMDFYMTLVANDPFELWQGDAMLVKFRDNDRSEAVRAYLPVVIYKMLYDLSCDEDVNVWDAFLAADKEVLTFVCKILERLGDAEISKVLLRLYSPRKDYSENIRACICANTEFFKARMLGYVRRNIEKFY